MGRACLCTIPPLQSEVHLPQLSILIINLYIDCFSWFSLVASIIMKEFMKERSKGICISHNHRAFMALSSITPEWWNSRNSLKFADTHNLHISNWRRKDPELFLKASSDLVLGAVYYPSIYPNSLSKLANLAKVGIFFSILLMLFLIIACIFLLCQ